MNLFNRPTVGRVFVIALLALLVLTACNTEEATPTPEPEPTDTAVSPTEAPTEEPTEEPTAVPPTEEPTAEPTATTEPTATPETTSATFEEADCEFNAPTGRDVTCGWLTVPEDRTNLDDDSTIRLHVAIFASESDDPAPDPIVYLEGGPGGEPLETVPFTFELLFAPFLANHDFIIFDQRGTGYSQPSLACPETRQLGLDLLEQDVTPEEALALTIDSLTECRDRLLEDGVNLAAYNSAANAADLNDLRLALGYDEWNLFGISYGTRLALTAMRDYPTGLRSVILDSTYPLEVNIVTDTPDNMVRAFDELFAGCVADPACNEAYPDLEETFLNLIERHNSDEIEMTVSNLFTGETYDTVMSGDELPGILFQSLYSTELIPSLPQLIYEIDAGEFTTLSTLVSSFITQGDFISMGMFLSVRCNEESSFTTIDDAAASAEKYPEYAEMFKYGIGVGPTHLEICELWGAGTADPIENESVSSDIPTLVLAGQYDPVTPPVWGEQVAGQLDNVYFYEFPGTGHGVSISGECGVSLVESFLADPANEPDATCLAEVSAPAFVVPGGEDVAITLVPFENSTFGIAGVVPEGWEEAVPGTYVRGSNALDQAAIIQQAVPGMDADSFLQLLASQLGWEEVPESIGSYEAESRTWTLYEAEVQGYPAIMATAEEDGTTIFVFLVSEADEQEALANAVFYPALDAVTLQ